jgi:hypothetical protein
MRILLIVADDTDADIIVLAENVSDRHIVKITDEWPQVWRRPTQPYLAKVADDLGNDLEHPAMKMADFPCLVDYRPNLRPGEFVIFPVHCFAPVEKAKYLDIELPSLALVTAERFHFKVPLKAEPVPQEDRAAQPAGMWGLVRTPPVLSNRFWRLETLAKRILFKCDDYKKWLKKYEVCLPFRV